MRNKKLSILGLAGMASITLLAVLAILNAWQPKLLELESRWLLVAAIPLFVGIIYSGVIHRFKGLGVEYEGLMMEEPSPSQRDLSGSASRKLELDPTDANNKIPADYFYINHISFLREKKQEEFQGWTKVHGLPHYDIRVIVDSYYKGALERIKYVVYYLHRAYPNPIQVRSDRKDHFCLKELANGEYVLLAEVFLFDLDKPIVLQRYISLWTSGPRLGEKAKTD